MTQEQSYRLDQMTSRLTKLKDAGFMTDKEAQDIWFMEYCKIVAGKVPRTARGILTKT